MAKELHISRNTVDRAYQQLLAEGYIRSVPGSGYYVEDTINEYFGEDKIDRKINTAKTYQNKGKAKIKYNFLYSSSDSTMFPWTKWRKYVQDALLDESDMRVVPYEVNKGSQELRESLCYFLNRHRGVNCEPDQIIIAAGTQYLMEILSSILPPTNYRVAFEEPGYDAMRNIFLTKGYSLTTIPVLEDGIDVELLTKTNCNLVYMTPSHQFPTGAVTPITKRQQILEWANQTDSYIIENDYDSEFRYGMSPIPSFQSLDESGKVIYMDTISKVMLPSMRCAYMVLPKPLIERYDTIYKYYNSALPSYHQRALNRFIAQGDLEKHIRRLSIINENKYRILVSALEKYLSEDVEIFQYPSGVHTLVRIPNCTNQAELLDYMRKNGIEIYGTKQYYYNQNEAKEDTFLIGFNAMSENEINQGCQLLGEVLKQYLNER